MSEDALQPGTQDISLQQSNAIAGRLGGQALYILAGNVFTLVVGLPLQIYVSRTLGAEGLGKFSLLDGMAGVVATLLGFGLAASAIRFIPQYLEQGEYKSIRTFVVRSSIGLFAVGCAGSVLFVALLPLVAPGKGMQVDLAVLILMGAAIPLGLLSYFTQQALRGFQSIRWMVLGSSVVQISVKALATLVLFSLGARLVGYAAATVLATLAAVVFLGIGLARETNKIASRLSQQQEPVTRPVSTLKRFALISYTTSLLSMPAEYLPRFLLGAFAGTSAVGVLAVARQLQAMPGVLYRLLLAVAVPMFARYHAGNAAAERAHLYALTTDWAVKSALPLVVFLVVFAGPVLSLFGVQFVQPGTWPLRIMVTAEFLALAIGPTGNLGRMSGLEREIFRIDVVALLGGALLLVPLVFFFGLVGTAMSMLLSTTVRSLWELSLVRARLGLKWWNPRYLSWSAPSLSTLAAALMAVLVFRNLGVVQLVLALVVMYTIFASLTYFQGLHDDDREVIARVKRLFVH